MTGELHVFDRLMEIAVLIQADLVRSFAGTGLVDALEAAGFVDRGPHPTDRRATLVTLTELGSQTMADMVRDRKLIASHLVADFGEDQLMQFARSLDIVTGRLRDLVESSQAPTPVTA